MIDNRSWLCQPPAGIDHFAPFNIHIHGIRPSDVVDEPPFRERFEAALNIIGDMPVVAHNASFDIGAIRDAYDAEHRVWPRMKYGCTLIWSRQLLKLISYTLPMVAHSLHIEFARHHDAGADAAAAAQIALALMKEQGATSLAQLCVMTGTTLGAVSPDLWAACHVLGSGRPMARVPQAKIIVSLDADRSNALYGQVVVFTGGLSSMVRSAAWAQVAGRGGLPATSVTRRTTRLVIGDGFTGRSPEQFHTGKAARATALLAEGTDIQVLTEQEFLAALTDTGVGGVRPQLVGAAA